MSWKKTKEYTKIWSLNEERTQDKYPPTYVHCFGRNRSIRIRIESIQAAMEREFNYLQLWEKPLAEDTKVRRTYPKTGALFCLKLPLTVLIITRSYELRFSWFKRPREENWVIYNHAKNKVLKVSKVRRTSQKVRCTSTHLMRISHRLKSAAHFHSAAAKTWI